MKKKVTLNIPRFINDILSGEVNYSKILDRAIREEIKRQQRYKSDGKLAKKTLSLDEELVTLVKEYKINLSQCLYNEIKNILNSKEILEKYKK